jgi:hypothetical protein
MKIKKENDLLKVDRESLLFIIENNPDKKSRDIDSGLIEMIHNYYGRFTVKQTAWIFTKVGFIVRSNTKFLPIKGFKDIDFE